MEQKEITTGNKLIAKFMGGKLKPATKEHPQNPYNKPTWWFDDTVGHFELQYNLSWDWLMPVVEKIAKEYPVRITWLPNAMEVTYIDRNEFSLEDTIADFGGFGSITNTWKCVVKFIEWHNQKFKTNTKWTTEKK